MPSRGFDHVEFAAHGPFGGHHYAAWLYEQHPEDVAGFGAVLAGAAGGDTGAPEVAHNRIPRAHYHTITRIGSRIARSPGCARSIPVRRSSAG